MKKVICMSYLMIIIISCGRPTPDENAHLFSILSTCHLPGYAEDLDLINDLVYVADDQGGLQIVDVSNPENPYIIGEYTSEKSIVGVAVRDTFAYLAVNHTQGGVRIINIADPENPVFVGEDNWYYGYNVVAPQNDTMYVYVAGGYWFVVEDVSFPQYPTFVRRFSTPGDIKGIFVNDSIVYLACEQMGLHIFDLAKPDSEALVGWIDTPSNARNVFVKEGYAYIADGRSGLIIIDISNPANPVITGQYDTPDYANDIFVENERAFLADGDGGLQIINIENPTDPLFYGELKTSYANGVYARGDTIYLADRDMGLLIIIEEETP
jgi:hypothetical protein